jgi:hypothetical protein
MGIYNQPELGEIAKKLNKHTCKTLGFNTPAEVFNDVMYGPLESAPTKKGRIDLSGFLEPISSRNSSCGC